MSVITVSVNPGGGGGHDIFDSQLAPLAVTDHDHRTTCYCYHGFHSGSTGNMNFFLCYKRGRFYIPPNNCYFKITLYFTENLELKWDKSTSCSHCTWWHISSKHVHWFPRLCIYPMKTWIDCVWRKCAPCSRTRGQVAAPYPTVYKYYKK